MKIKSFLTTAVLAIAVVCSASFVKAQTVDNSALIAQLKAEIQSLLQQITQLQGQQTTTAWCHTFSTYLVAGDGGMEVFALQDALNKEGLYTGNISEANEFDDNTAAAVVQFQAKYGIRQTGTVGPMTRAKLNVLYGCSVVINATPTPSPLGTPMPTPILYPTPTPETQSIGTLIPSDTFLNFNLVQGGTATPYNLHLTNASTSAVNFTISAPNQPAWLNTSYNTQPMSLQSGGVMGVGVSVDSTKVSGPGTYTTNLMFTGNFSNSPIIIPITLTVTAPSGITITSPTTSASWQRGALQTMTWSPSNQITIPNVDIYLVSNASIFNGTNSLLLIGGQPNSGTFSWSAGNFKDGVTSIAPDGNYSIWVCPSGKEVGPLCGSFNVNIYTGASQPTATITASTLSSAIVPQSAGSFVGGVVLSGTASNALAVQVILVNNSYTGTDFSYSKVFQFLLGNGLYGAVASTATVSPSGTFAAPFGNVSAGTTYTVLVYTANTSAPTLLAKTTATFTIPQQ